MSEADPIPDAVGAWTADLPEIPPPEPARESEGPPPTPLRIVEALLFVGGPPLTAERVMRLVRGLSAEAFHECVDRLAQDYRLQNRPYAVVARERGFSLEARPKFRLIEERLFGGVREARLSAAAVDALAVVAYRQPTTKPEVDSLRGADSGPLLKQLVRRGLLQVIDAKAEGGPKYVTTARFLEMFGLQSLDDLPKALDLA